MIEAVIFDMDGVIFDSECKVLECWTEIAHKWNIPNIKATFLECVGTNTAATKRIFEKTYGLDFSYEEFRIKASKLFHERYDNGRLPMKSGVFELLDYLKGRGIKLGLASSTRVALVKQELLDAGCLHYFDEVIGGDMVEHSKPDPEIFIKAGRALGVNNKQNAFVIEDSYNGIRAAYKGGFKAVMVPDLLEPTKEMEELSTIILPDLNSVIEYFEKEHHCE